MPTARTRSAARIRSHVVRLHLVALAVDPVLLEPLLGHRPERVEPDVERDAARVEPREQLRREVQAGGRRRGRAHRARVDGLVAGGIGERLRDVRRQRRLARGLALETEAPAPLAEVLDQLDRPVPAAGPQPPRRPRERLPRPVVESLEQEQLAARRLDRDPRRHDLRVVDDDELPVQLLGQLVEPAVPDVAGRAFVDEQPRRVTPLGGILRDQLRRQLVVELGDIHPTPVVPSRSWIWTP